MRRFLTTAVSLLTLVWCTSTAHAHARLLRSEPADKSELAKPPERVELWFNELLEEDFNQVEVFRATSSAEKKQQATSKRISLVEGKPTLDSRDATHLTVRLQPLSPGEYVVEWRVLSRDGHSAPGRFTFKVLGQH